MMPLPVTQLQARLSALDEGLDRFPAGLMCPWPLARVFNECLKQAKALAADDPVLSGIRSVRQREPDADEATGTALVGTVQALVKQVRAALDAQPPPAKTARSAKAATKGSGRRAG